MLKSLVFIIVSVFSSSSFANDSTARIGAGGITLLKSDQIKMVEEVLEISTKKISVKYRFRNESTKDITTFVAFPLPRRNWDPERHQPGHLEGFKLIVDGRDVPTTREIKAVFQDSNITAKLRTIGLTEQQIFETFGGCGDDFEKPLCELNDEKKLALAKLSGDQNLHFPFWGIDETYHWEQNFPAGKEVVVQHEYSPFVGSMYHAPYQRGFGFLEGGALIAPRDGGKEACIDNGTIKAISRRVALLAKDNPQMVYVGVDDVEYVLGTGRNWKGPIERFKLRLKKSKPDEFISVCMPGKAQKVDTTTFEFNQVDFIPQDSLVVYFYSVIKSN